MIANKNSYDIPTPKTENSETDLNQNETTFNRLKDLQSLIKKESALKELCKKLYFNNENIIHFSCQYKK